MVQEKSLSKCQMDSNGESLCRNVLKGPSVGKDVVEFENTEKVKASDHKVDCSVAISDVMVCNASLDSKMLQDQSKPENSVDMQSHLHVVSVSNKPKSLAVDSEIRTADKIIVSSSKLNNRNRKLTSSTPRSIKAPENKSPAGIKPYLCLKGKLTTRDLRSPRVKDRIKVREKVENFESVAKAAGKTEAKKESKVKSNSQKIKLMVELFEKESAPKMVHAPNIVEVCDKISSVDGNTDKNVKIRNAFDVLMNSGGGPKIKTPGKNLKRIGKSSARKKK